MSCISRKQLCACFCSMREDGLGLQIVSVQSLASGTKGSQAEGVVKDSGCLLSPPESRCLSEQKVLTQIGSLGALSQSNKWPLSADPSQPRSRDPLC